MYKGWEIGVLPGRGNLKKELARDKDFVALGSIHQAAARRWESREAETRHPPSRSASRRASHICCGPSWMPTLRRATFMLCMSTVPIGLQLNSLKMSWKAEGGERGLSPR